MKEVLRNIKEENKKIIIITMILVINLVLAKAKYLPLVCILLIISLFYTISLIRKNQKIIRKITSSNCFWWIALFAIVMFLYGIFAPAGTYSLKFHLLNLVSILMFIVILYSDNKKVVDKLAISSSIVIGILVLFTIVINVPGLIEFINEGRTFSLNLNIVGNKNSLAVSYIFLLIPIIYKIFLRKDKRYIYVSILGVFALLLTGSKKGIISLLIIFIILIFPKIKKNNFKTYLPKIIAGVVILILMCYFVPLLHTLIWDRFEAMFNSIIHFNSQDQSSTGIRINAILTVLTKMWDKPIFGHGWGSYAQMYGYSSLYQSNLYTHNNYAEILFSFGLFGFLLYYWFPFRMIRKNFFNKNKHVRTLCWMYIINILFIDFGTVLCYDSVIGFFIFVIIGVLLNDQDEKLATQKQGDIELIVRKIITLMKLFDFTIRGIKIKKTLRSNISLSANIYNFGKSIEIGEIYVRANTSINTEGEGNISIDDKVFINRNCVISSRDSIEIKENCVIGPNVCIYDHDHNFDETGLKSGYSLEKVIIEKNCWIGAGSIILKGTHIGENSIIAAGTVVKGEYAPNSIVYNKKETVSKKITSR